MKKYTAFLLAALMIVLCACSSNEEDTIPSADPHEGMVEVESGLGTLMWAKEYENVLRSEFSEEEFAKSGQVVTYSGDKFETSWGIDISEHQHEIDWEKVGNSEVSFAIVRVGYRGYSVGSLFEDEFFRSNIEGAVQNGIDVGVYFFSQAITVEEAKQEAQFVLDLIAGYDITLPVFFDWETIGTEPARTDEVSPKILTDCAIAFCEEISGAGYTPGIYMYRYLGYYSYDLARVSDYTIWMGAIGDYPDFYYSHDIWQYSISGQIDGISTDVDLNLRFIPIISAEENLLE